MKLGKALKWTAIIVPLLFVALIVGALAVLMNTDFNKYKPRIAEEVRKATGRELVIAGDLAFEISFNPAITVNGVTFSNAAWGSRPEMAKVDRFEAQIAIIPLIWGTLLIDRFVLIGADILLEVDKQGRANFAFAPPAPAPAKPAAPAAEEAAAKELDIPVGIREIVIEKSVLTYRDATAGSRYRAVIDELKLQGESPTDPVSLRFRGSYNDAPIRLDANLGAPIELLRPSGPWPVDATLEAGGAKVRVKGTIAEPAKGKGIDLSLAAEGDQLGDLSALAGAEIPPLGAYSLSARVAGDPASRITLSGLKSALAGSDLNGDVVLRLAGKRPAIEAKLNARKIDLDLLGGAAGAAGQGDAAAGSGPAPAAESDRLFPDDPLPLEALQAADAAVTLEAATVVASGVTMERALIGVSLKEGNLVVSPLRAAVADGSIDGGVQLDARGKAAQLGLKALADKVDLERLLAELKITQDVEGKANADIDVRGSGQSVRAIMASLNGRAVLLMGQGRMKDTFMNSMLGGPANLLNQILDKGRKGYTVIECGIADFAIKNGVANASALYLDADTMGILGSGSIDLRNETLNLVVDPRRMKNFEQPQIPVRIGGTLKNPTYKAEGRAVAGQVTRMLGIQLPPGLTGQSGGAATPLIEGPCAPPVPAASQQPAQPAASPTAPAAPAVPAAPQEQLKGLEQELQKGLKGLLGQ